MSEQTLNEMEFEFRSRKAGRSVSVVWADLPLASQAAIVRYGAMRFINDKLGGLEADEAAEAFDTILNGLRSGWQPRTGTSAASVADPVERRALQLATTNLKALLTERGILHKDVGRERIKELSAELLEKHRDMFMTRAAEALAAEAAAQEAASEGIDLSDLGL